MLKLHDSDISSSPTTTIQELKEKIAYLEAEVCVPGSPGSPGINSPAEAPGLRRWIPPELVKQIRLLEIRTDRAVDELVGGAYRSIFKGRGIEFDEVREYVPGDDVRTIDWNVSARTGSALVRPASS